MLIANLAFNTAITSASGAVTEASLSVQYESSAARNEDDRGGDREDERPPASTVSYHGCPAVVGDCERERAGGRQCGDNGVALTGVDDQMPKARREAYLSVVAYVEAAAREHHWRQASGASAAAAEDNFEIRCKLARVFVDDDRAHVMGSPDELDVELGDVQFDLSVLVRQSRNGVHERGEADHTNGYPVTKALHIRTSPEWRGRLALEGDLECVEEATQLNALARSVPRAPASCILLRMQSSPPVEALKDKVMSTGSRQTTTAHLAGWDASSRAMAADRVSLLASAHLMEGRRGRGDDRHQG